MYTQGIDVASDQGQVAWERVREAGIGFAYLKATEGLERDRNQPSRRRYFQANWPQIKEAGLARGAYHFFRANLDSERQADAFLEAVGTPAPDDLPPMLDVETDDGEKRELIVLRAHRWLEKVQRETGVRPVVYTYTSFLDEFLDGSFGAYPLWIANYGANRPTPPAVPRRSPRLPAGWEQWTLWQYGSNGRVAGIDGNVDLSLLRGSAQELSALCHAATAA